MNNKGVKRHCWLQEEIDYLVANYRRIDAKKMSAHLNLPVWVIRYKAHKLGLMCKASSYWEGISDEWLKEQYIVGQRTAKEIAEEINKPLNAVTAKLYRLDCQKYKVWPQSHIQFLKDHYRKDMKTRDIANKLGVTIMALRARVSTLGLNKRKKSNGKTSNKTSDL